MKIEIQNLLDINHTISKKLFLENINFIEIVSKLENKIIALGEQLDKNKYMQISENVWVAKSAIIDENAKIVGPCIIDENTEIRHCAYIRENVIIGKNCVIGNSCELKNSIIFDKCQIPHFNYVGDSIIGYHSNLGAGTIISNLKNDQSDVIIKTEQEQISTGRRKFGAIIGDFVTIGCNSTTMPGTIIYPNVSVYSNTCVRGVIPKNSIVKSKQEIVRKEVRNVKNVWN